MWGSAELSDFILSKNSVPRFILYVRAIGAADGYKTVFDLITDFRKQMKELSFSLGSTVSAFHDTLVFIKRYIRDNWKNLK